jgi:hypothetical protein
MGYDQRDSTKSENPFEGQGANLELDRLKSDPRAFDGQIGGLYLSQVQQKQEKQKQLNAQADDRASFRRIMDTGDDLDEYLAKLEADLKESIERQIRNYKENDKKVLEGLNSDIPDVKEGNAAYKAHRDVVGRTITVQLSEDLRLGDKLSRHVLVSFENENDRETAYVEVNGKRHYLFSDEFTKDEQDAFRARIKRQEKELSTELGGVYIGGKELRGDQMSPEQRKVEQHALDKAYERAQRGNNPDATLADQIFSKMYGDSSERSKEGAEINERKELVAQVRKEKSGQKDAAQSPPEVFRAKGKDYGSTPTQTIAPPSPDTPVISGPRKLAIADDVYTEYAVQRFVAAFNKVAEQMTVAPSPSAPSFATQAPSQSNAYKA